jgi:hypothetical protein
MSHITKNSKNNITSEPLLWEWSQNSAGENPVGESGEVDHLNPE